MPSIWPAHSIVVKVVVGEETGFPEFVGVPVDDDLPDPPFRPYYSEIWAGPAVTMKNGQSADIVMQRARSYGILPDGPAEGLSADEPIGGLPVDAALTWTLANTAIATLTDLGSHTFRVTATAPGVTTLTITYTNPAIGVLGMTPLVGSPS